MSRWLVGVLGLVGATRPDRGGGRGLDSAAASRPDSPIASRGRRSRSPTATGCRSAPLGPPTARWPDGYRSTEMDPDLIAAFLALEDRRFQSHGGVDLRAVARATRANLAAGRVVSGASTITMQLARILRPFPRTWAGKVRQALWAIRLERHLDKATILEQYLNRVPLGQSAVGADAAASLYFGARASALSLGQAALLAGLARAPSSDNPLVSAGRAWARRTAALGRLAAQGYAGPSEVERAEQEPLLGGGTRTGFLAPHFTTRLLSRADAPASGDWRTSLDLGLQQELEAEVRHTVESLRDRGARHAALVVLDNASGEILAWVGSPDFWADTAGQVDMVGSPRQPGSALKPFLYGLAFDRGWTPASVLADVPRVYRTATGVYAPRNYDRRFHGPARIREALASSYNIPAVELANRLGTGSFHATLLRAGFSSLSRSAEHYGLGLALGNGDVTLLELANAYRALANDGVWRPVRWRPRAPDEADGPGRRVHESNRRRAGARRACRPGGAGAGIRSRDAARPPVSRRREDRHQPPLHRQLGGRGDRRVHGRHVGRRLQRSRNGRRERRDGRRAADAPRRAPRVAPLSPGHAAPAGRRRRGAGADLPRFGTACHRPVSADDRVGPAGSPAGRACDWHGPEGVRLPEEYLEWAGGQAGGAGGPLLAPAAESLSAGPAARPPAFRILSPQDGDRYRVPPGVPSRYATLPLRASISDGVRWYVDGNVVRSSRWPLARGTHVVRAELAAGARAEARIEVE